MRSGDGNPDKEPFLFTSPDLLRVMSDTLNQSETFPKKCRIRTLQIHATRLMPIILDQEVFWLFAMFIQQPFNKNTDTKTVRYFQMRTPSSPKRGDGREFKNANCARLQYIAGDKTQ
jgi:hypothetical protein